MLGAASIGAGDMLRPSERQQEAIFAGGGRAVEEHREMQEEGPNPAHIASTNAS